MKKTFITLQAVVFLLSTTIIASCSQNMVPQTPKPDTGLADTGKEVNTPIHKNEVSIRAIRSFYESYGEQQVANWFRSPEGFMVSFEKDGVKTLINYTLSGLEENRIKSYPEEKLSPAVRHIVRSNFYDYAIAHITEIQKNEATAFYVKIQDTHTMKTIKIVDGEWEIVEDLARLSNKTKLK